MTRNYIPTLDGEFKFTRLEYARLLGCTANAVRMRMRHGKLADEYILREGRPEDKLTISTGYDLPVLPKELPIKIDELWTKIEQREGIHKNKYRTWQITQVTQN